MINLWQKLQQVFVLFSKIINKKKIYAYIYRAYFVFVNDNMTMAI